MALVIGAILAAAPGGGDRAAAATRRTTPAVAVVLTTHSGARRLTTMPSLRFVRRRFLRPTLHIDDRARLQTITGFGAAMTDSSAWLLYDELSPRQRAAAMTALFSPTMGLGLNLIRVPMGASDFSASGVPYTYDDVPAGQADPTLAGFSIAHDRSYVLPALQQMEAVNPAVRILATEWSAPAWMKNNDALDDVNGAGQLNNGDYGALAQYFVRFIQSYLAARIPIWAITPENEPGAQSRYPGMKVSAAQEGQFISKDLVPALAEAGLHPLVFGGDQAQLSYADALMDTPAGTEIAGMAWHCYRGMGVLSAFHAAYPAVPELMSECSPGIAADDPAETAIDALRNDAEGVDLWNLALDPAGGPVQPPNSGCPRCTGLLSVNEQSHAAYPRLGYYQLGQLSRFIHPGAVVLGDERGVSDSASPSGNGVTVGLDNVAAINPDGTRVVVAYNNSAASQTFAVAWRRWQFAYTLPAHATVTFTWR